MYRGILEIQQKLLNAKLTSRRTPFFSSCLIKLPTSSVAISNFFLRKKCQVFQDVEIYFPGDAPTRKWKSPIHRCNAHLENLGISQTKLRYGVGLSVAGSTWTRVTSCHREIVFDPLFSAALMRYSVVFSSPCDWSSKLDEDPWDRPDDERRGLPRGTSVSIPNTMFDRVIFSSIIAKELGKIMPRPSG